MCPYLLEIHIYAYINIFINKSDIMYRNCFKIVWRKVEFGIGEIKLATY